MKLQESNSQAIQTDQFDTTYNTNPLDNLTLSELTTTQRYEEFILRFLATPIQVVLQNYIYQLSDTLIDQMRSDFIENKENESLTNTQKNNLTYWLEHDFKAKQFYIFGTLTAGYQNSKYKLESPNYELSSISQAPYLITSVTANSQLRAQGWKWSNGGVASLVGQQGTYTYAEDSDPAQTSSQSIAAIYGSVASFLNHDEDVRFQLLGYGARYLNVLPDNIQSFYSIQASTDGTVYFDKNPNRPRFWTGELSFQISDQKSSQPVDQTQPSSSYSDFQIGANTSYQVGKSAVMSRSNFYQSEAISAYSSEKGLGFNSLLFGKFELSDSDIHILTGAGFTTDSSYRSLTQLDLYNTGIEQSTSITIDLGSDLSVDTDFTADYNYATGDLEGWYFELSELQETISYHAGFGKLSLFAGISSYNRTLQDLNAIDRQQASFGYLIGADADLWIGNNVEWKNSFSYSNSNESGYRPVDDSAISANSTLSLVLTKPEAKRSVSVDTVGNFSLENSNIFVSNENTRNFSVQTSLVIK